MEKETQREKKKKCGDKKNLHKWNRTQLPNNLICAHNTHSPLQTMQKKKEIAERKKAATTT